MYKSVLVSAVVAFVFMTGCSPESKSNMMPELSSCDSAAVMFYKTPGNPRFFTMSKVYDKAILSTIEKDVNGKLISGKDSCISQGKIYYYGKGDAVHVVYFSKAAGCKTLSFIKTAEKYFTNMDNTTEKLLDDLQKTAKEPKN
jgi:hypothetical protein